MSSTNSSEAGYLIPIVTGVEDIEYLRQILLERPRSADVHAATDGRILSLSEGTLRKAIENDPQVAAQLLLNLSEMLCFRVLESS